MLVLALIASIAALASAGCAEDPNPELLVLAASDLKKAFALVADRFETEEGIRVKYSFGSTGQLAQQVQAGARADVFAAANVDFIEQLKSEKLIVTDTQRIYAIGRLVIWSEPNAEFHPSELSDLAKSRVERVAIANPDHAPYGKAAKEALQKAGVWNEVSPKLVLGENATQAFQFGESGNVDAAIVPLSLASGSEGTFYPVPESLHKPLQQSIAVLSENRNEKAARAFVDFVTGPEGRKILKDSGFQIPE